MRYPGPKEILHKSDEHLSHGDSLCVRQQEEALIIAAECEVNLTRSFDIQLLRGSPIHHLFYANAFYLILFLSDLLHQGAIFSNSSEAK